MYDYVPGLPGPSRTERATSYYQSSIIHCYILFVLGFPLVVPHVVRRVRNVCVRVCTVDYRSSRLLQYTTQSTTLYVCVCVGRCCVFVPSLPSCPVGNRSKTALPTFCHHRCATLCTNSDDCTPVSRVHVLGTRVLFPFVRSPSVIVFFYRWLNEPLRIGFERTRVLHQL